MPEPTEESHVICARARQVIDRENRARSENEPALEFVGMPAADIVQVRVPGLSGCCPSSVMPWVIALEKAIRAEIPSVRHLEVVS